MFDLNTQRKYQKAKLLEKEHFKVDFYLTKNEEKELFIKIESQYNLNYFKPLAKTGKSKSYKYSALYRKFLIKKKIRNFENLKSKVIKNSKYIMMCKLMLNAKIKNEYYLLVLRSDHKTIPIAEGNIEKCNYKRPPKKQKRTGHILSFLQKVKYAYLKNSITHYLQNIERICSSGLTLREYLRKEVSFRKFNLVFENNARTLQETPFYHEFSGTGVVGKTRFLVNGSDCKIEYISKAKKLKMYTLQEELIGACKIENPNEIFIKIDSMRVFRGRWMSLFHNGSENWLHWMTEVLPRIHADLSFVNNLDGILVDDELPESMYQSLNMSGVQCRIVRIPRHTLVKCETLVVPRVTSYCLMWEKNYKKILGGEWEFDEEAIRKMQTTLNMRLPFEDKNKAVYIRRKSMFRKIINEKEVRKMMLKRNYKVISPSSMNLERVVSAIRSARVFVLQAGAAFGNAVFAPKQSTFLIICSHSKRIHLNYLKQIGKILNHKILFIKSNWDRKSSYCPKKIYSIQHPVNANIKVNIERLLKHLPE